MGCDVKSIEAAARESLKDKYTGDALDIEVAALTNQLVAERTYWMSRKNTVEKYLQENIPSRAFVHYSNDNPLKSGESKEYGIKKVTYSPRSRKAAVILDNDHKYTFEQGSDKSLPTKANGNVVEIPSVTSVIKRGYANDVLYNNAELTDEDIDRLFLAEGNTEDTILNIRDELHRLDEGLMGNEYDSEHGKHLADTLDSVMKLSKELGDVKVTLNSEQLDAVVEPYGQFNKSDPLSPIRIKTGTLSQDARNKLTMTNEETLVHEVVHAALDWVFSPGVKGTEADALKAQVQKLYNTAKNTLTWKDLVNDSTYTEAEEAAAKSRYDYIFGVKDKDDTRAAYARLQEFMAYAMTNKQMKTALTKATTSTKKQEYNSRYDKIVHAIADFFANIMHKFTTPSGANMDKEVTKTIYKLIAIKDKYGSEVALRRGKRVDEKVSDSLNKVLDAIDSKIAKPVDSMLQNTLGITKNNMTQEEFDNLYNPIKHNWPKETDNILVKLIKVARILPKFKAAIQGADDNNRVHVAVLWGNFLSAMKIAEDSFLRNLFADFTGGRKTLEKVTDLTMEFRSHIDRLRHQNYEGTLVDVYKSMFTNIDLLEKENIQYDKSLEAVVMVADVQSLGANSNEELVDIIKNPSKHATKLEAKIAKGASADKYSTMINDAKKAAMYMVTGVGLRTNAENIVRGFGSPSAASYGDVQVDQKLVENIDKLISLYALNEVSTQAKSTFLELAEKDPNGVMAYVEYARGLQVAMKEEYDKYEPHSYVKGQVRDSYNKDRDLKIAPIADKKKLNDIGYTLVEVLDNDLHDNDPVQYGKYVNSNLNIAGRVDGSVGLQREVVGGLLLIDKIRQSNPGLTEDALWKLYTKSKNRLIARYEKGKDIGAMHPIFNSSGTIIDFRLGISKNDKIQYLGLDTRGAEVLAKSEGHIGTQPMTDEENEKVLDILYKDYEDTYVESKDPTKDTSKMFLHVRAKDFDLSEEARREMYEAGHKDLLNLGRYGIKTKGEELWGLLPPAARESIIARNIKVDKEKTIADSKIKGTEVYKQIHSTDPRYRMSLKEQLAAIETNPRKELYIRKDLIAQLFGYNEPSVTDMKIFNKLTASSKYKVQVVESYWKDFIGLLKGNVVVRMPSTIWNNILSNMRILFYSGVPVRESVTYIIKSIRSLDEWKKDEEALHRLQRLVKGAKGSNKSRLLRDISDVQYKLDSNPLKPLMAKGLYQSVIDDVAIYDDTNKVSKKLRGVSEKVTGSSGLARDVVETLFLTQRSAAGKTLLRAARESDFHFRAAMYWAKMEKGVAEEDVFRFITDSFINYSKVINSKVVRWLERMGPEAFWTYFAGIQRVNIRMLKQSPARVAASKAEQIILGDESDIFDSNLFSMFFSRLNLFHGLGGLLKGGTEVPFSNIL